MDQLLNEELTRFERYFTKVQKDNGFDGAPLATFERCILKSYLIFAATTEEGDG